MKKKCFKFFSMTTFVMGTLLFSACGCNAGKVKVTFVTEGNSDIIRYVKKGKSLSDLPVTPEVKGKYCEWDTKELKNLKEDTTVTALCYSLVTNLKTNVPDQINVDVASDEAELNYIFKDAEFEVTFESGEKKKLYPGEYKINENGYNKDVGGSYVVSIEYNNIKKDVTINVNKKNNYLSVSLDGGKGYYNEGLPKLIANTDVEGTLSFDENQELYIGSKSYNWTFVPANTNLYEIVKGSIDVYLYPANGIRANKSSLTVDFGTTKEEIISMIKDGLVVEANYANSYKVIDPMYYTIECKEFMVDKALTYEFKIVYDQNNKVSIFVTVEKCKDYSVSVGNINDYIIDNSSSLESIANEISVNSSILGKISFASGQKLTPGDYEYDYIFTPDSVHYDIKTGKVRIKSYKAQELSFDTITDFAYGTSANDVIQGLKENIVGSIIYNDSHTIALDKNKILIVLSNEFVSTDIGIHEYTITYNNEISVVGTFNINKKVLELGVDFTYTCDEVDVNNPTILPRCTIIKLNDDISEDIESLFEIVQLSSTDNEDGTYSYIVKLIPDHSISYKYDSIIITMKADLN